MKGVQENSRFFSFDMAGRISQKVNTLTHAVLWISCLGYLFALSEIWNKNDWINSTN
mgnify:CR=1 FL=1